MQHDVQEWIEALTERSLEAAADAADRGERSWDPILKFMYQAKANEHKRWAAHYSESTPTEAMFSDSPETITRSAIRALTLAATRRMPFLNVTGEEAIRMAQLAWSGGAA